MKDPIARFLKYQSDKPRPIPLISWIILFILIAAISLETYFLVNPNSSDPTWFDAIIFLVSFVLVTYTGVWILTYYHYRRFLTTKKGLNFFTSKWFRCEQFLLYGSTIFMSLPDILEYKTIAPDGLIFGPMLAGCWFIIIYSYDFIVFGRYNRHKRDFVDQIGRDPLEYFDNRMK